MANDSQTLANNQHCNNANCEYKEGVKEKAIFIRDHARKISKDVREVCLELRPYILEHMGLIPAIRLLIERMQTGINIRLTITGEEQRVSSETECMLYRIIQEALNNIKRHSMVSEAEVSIELSSECWKIVIKDNGKGFILPENYTDFTKEGKLGIIGIHQRVQFLSGDVVFKSRPAEGATILINIPVKSLSLIP